MKTLKILLIVALMLAALQACKKAAAPKPKELQKVTVTLDWTPNTNHAGLYVAQELGYFAAQGLEVVIQQPGQSVTDQIVAAGKSEFGISYQENVIRARSENIPLVSIAAVIQHNTSGFASLATANIKSPRDFEEKRYGSWDSPSEQAILKTIMSDNEADFEKVEIISGVYDFFSTIGKDADFEWIYYGWDGVEAERRGLKLNYLALKDINPIFDYYTPVIITNEGLLANQPELAKKFLQAVSKGYLYAVHEPVKTAEIMMKHVPELNAEQVQRSMAYLAKEYQADAPYWGYQDSEVWKRFGDWMFEERLINLSVPANSAFSNDFLPGSGTKK